MRAYMSLHIQLGGDPSPIFWRRLKKNYSLDDVSALALFPFLVLILILWRGRKREDDTKSVVHS